MNNNNYINYEGNNPFNYPMASSTSLDVMDPFSYPYPQLPVQLLQQPMQQPVIQASFYYQQNIPVYPTLNKDGEIAHQAYLGLYQSDLQVMSFLPSLELVKTSIQTLKQIEERSDRGVVNALLTLMIKVLQVVGKLALGIVVGFSVALIVSALLGLHAYAVFFSLTLASPGIMALILGGIVCKIAAFALKGLKKRWVEHSFEKDIQAKPIEVQDLKSWIQVKDRFEIEKRFYDTIGKIELAQQTNGYILSRSEQLFYLRSLVVNIADFRQMIKNLNFENSMPLLNRYLAK